MADYDFATINDYIEQDNITMLYAFFDWDVDMKNSAILWKYAFTILQEKKGDKEVEALYSLFFDNMLIEAEMLKTADDIEKFAISGEFKLLKHKDKVEIVENVYSAIPDEFKKFRKNLNKLH